MITVIVHWIANEGLGRAEMIERLKKSIPAYQGHPHLLRKYICLDLAHGRGKGIYLWDDRQAAERFYEMARPILKQETGHDPEIEFLDTAVIVDNLTGETQVFD